MTYPYNFKEGEVPKSYERVDWQMRQERTANDYGLPESGANCTRCRLPNNQFNHTLINCEKRGWIREKEADVALDTLVTN